MKANFLKIDTPCEEKWENMKPNKTGSFCDLCSKNVIDFTQLSSTEISIILSKSNGKICARITNDQLKTPLLNAKIPREFNFPFKNVAAGIMLTSALIGCQNTTMGEVKIETELIASNTILNTSESQKAVAKPEKKTSLNFTTFKGIITAEKTGKSIENAEITLVTIHKQIKTYSLKDGSFSMEIPNELIDDDNVFRVTYEEVVRTEEENNRSHGYESADYILNKLQIKSNYKIKAKDLVLYLGGIGSYSEDYNPVVLVNGKEISYREFQKAQRGKKSTCDLNNKEYLFFESKEAIAIFGHKAKDGLYIITDKK